MEKQNLFKYTENQLYRYYEYKNKIHKLKIKVEDLEPTSTILVHIACDICGEESIMQYRDYCRTLGENGLKTCTKCKYIKTKKNNMEKYGVQSTSQLDSVKEKIKKTNREDMVLIGIQAIKIGSKR